jgi:SseB protein N-terminal domain
MERDAHGLAGGHAPAPAGSGVVNRPQGWELTGPGEFADDDGRVPDALAVLLEGRRAGAAGLRDIVPVLSAYRLLVPLLEVDAGALDGDEADPCAGQDRAVAAVSMRIGEGSLGLAFTGIDSLVAWNPQARPMPVRARRVAEAVLAEGGIGLVIDPGSPSALMLRGPALVRLASGAPWPPPWQDPAVQQAVIDELAPALAAGDLAVRLADPAAGAVGGNAGAGLLVELRMDATPSEERRARAEVVARRLGASRALREVYDGVLAVTLA